jgi:hypothetical protein
VHRGGELRLRLARLLLRLEGRVADLLSLLPSLLDACPESSPVSVTLRPCLLWAQDHAGQVTPRPSNRLEMMTVLSVFAVLSIAEKTWKIGRKRKEGRDSRDS